MKVISRFTLVTLFFTFLLTLFAFLILPSVAIADEGDASQNPSARMLTTSPQEQEIKSVPQEEPAIKSTKSSYYDDENEAIDLWEHYSSGYLKFRGGESEYVYTGEAITQDFTLYDSWYGNLYEGKDYTLKYKNNVNAGTAELTISGTGRFTGGIVWSYKITPQSFNEVYAYATGIKDKRYNGRAITQSLNVYVDDKKLKAGKDYKVIYKNNVNKGRASVRVDGIGNYSGSFTNYFQIVGPGWNDFGGNGWRYKYMKSNGSWLKSSWKKSGGKWYYLDKYGFASTGWEKIKGKWYFFDRASSAMKTGWIKDGSKWYYANSSGVMQTGWKKIGSKWYYFKGSGVMASNEWCKGYWLDQSGVWTYKAKGSWHRSGPRSWWFSDSKGWYPRDCYMVIDGYEYRFNSYGEWVGTAYKVS